MFSRDIPELILKPGREKPLLRKHPWIFSGSVAALRGTPNSGDLVKISTANDNFLCWAGYSPASQIRARVWSFIESDCIDKAFFRNKLINAINLRIGIGYSLPVQTSQNTAFRLVHAESDGLPGIILDLYGTTLVIQLLSAGAEPWRDVLANLAIELTGAEQIFERSDADVRRLEGLPFRIANISGAMPSERIVINENHLNFFVDIRQGHKTGFYLDQSANRLKVRALANQREVLDCFCYTGGFTANALAGGAKSVLAVDSSADALALSRENIHLNNLPIERVEFQNMDVFQLLRKFRDSRRTFDMIVLDPPKFAPTTAQVERAARGYKDINLLAFKLLRPGGILATFSCSGGVNAELFQSIVAGAALDAGVDAQILEHLHQNNDHPISLNFPEGAYLKGFIIRVT